MVLKSKAVLTSAELLALDNEQIASRLLFVLTHDTDKKLGDVVAIANELHRLASHYEKGVKQNE